MLRGKRRNVVESSDEDEPSKPVQKATRLNSSVSTTLPTAPTIRKTDVVQFVSSSSSSNADESPPRGEAHRINSKVALHGGGFNHVSTISTGGRSLLKPEHHRISRESPSSGSFSISPSQPSSPEDPFAEILEAATKEALRCKNMLMKNFGPQSSKFIQNGRTIILKPSTIKDPIETENMALKCYQRAGVQWLETLLEAKSGAILADEMGLGKTLEILTFLERQFRDGRAPNDGPALVVVPTSLLVNWEEEVKRWTKLSLFRYHDTVSSVRDQLAETYFSSENDADLILTTPNILLNQQDRRNFFRRVEPYSFLICDEGHFLRNPDTNKVKCMRNINAGMRILLTGTPIQNELSELVNLLWFILPDSFGPIKDSFSQKMSLPISEIRKVGAPFILRRSKQDVLGDLPSKNVVTLWCDMDEKQRKAYEEAANKTDESEFKNMYSRLRRICNGPILAQLKFAKEDYDNLAGLLRSVRGDYATASDYSVMKEITSWSDFNVHQMALDNDLKQPFLSTSAEIMSGCKIQALVKLLRERKDMKTLVFSQFTQYLDVLEATLLMHGYTFLRLDGSTPSGQRQSAVHSFNSPEGPNIFLLSTKAGGSGLNLVAADACVLMDLDFNPQNNRQAEDRIHRLGQTRDVTIYYMICRDTIEEKILEIDARKMQLDVKFGGNKQDADAKIMKWILQSGKHDLQQFLRSQSQ